MSLLELEHVGKCYGPLSERVVLRDVSLRIEQGEMVAVWGMRRSGRSTLLRVAAGVERPDTGIVRFEGRDLSARDGARLGGGIGYCRKTFAPSEGQRVIDHIVVGQVACGVPLALAATRAREALERVQIAHCATLRPTELDCAEAVRAAIARALAFAPRLLLIDEPTIGVDLLARDDILRLLLSLAKAGIAVLASTGESPALSGARALTLSEGELHGPPAHELATVVPLRHRA
ncbi:MAG: ATP-binding cassette domain-containing protein [Solirubrobacteraceae bacterium]